VAVAKEVFQKMKILQASIMTMALLTVQASAQSAQGISVTRVGSQPSSVAPCRVATRKLQARAA
jgi:hypothetical protein